MLIYIMDKDNISPELAFLKDVFLPYKWEKYIGHINILSSHNPEDWGIIDFPLEIALELTNYCNLRCVMCPTPTLKRSRGFMDEAVFRKIAEDISQKSGFLFLPQGFGELLLHDKWFQLIDFASHMKIQPIVVLTNGMLLNKENILRLINTVDIIAVTIDGITAKTYESIRVNGRYEIVIKNIENFLEIRGDNDSPHLVLRIIRMKETEGEIELFRTFWSDKIGKGDLLQVAEFNDWTGIVTHTGINKMQTERDRHPCRMLWKNLTVYYDGQVSPCCYDAEAGLIIGNIINQNLKEIWNGSRLNNLRKLHLNREFEKIPLCSRCTSWL